MKKKLHPELVRVLFWVIFIIGVIIGLLSTSIAFTCVGFFLIAAAMVFYGIFYRCPHCGKHLGRNTGETCSRCGKSINE